MVVNDNVKCRGRKKLGYFWVVSKAGSGSRRNHRPENASFDSRARAPPNSFVVQLTKVGDFLTTLGCGLRLVGNLWVDSGDNSDNSRELGMVSRM